MRGTPTGVVPASAVAVAAPGDEGTAVITPLVEYLRQYAQKKSLDTTRKFADAVGIPKTTADNLLKGRPPKSETLEKIADNTGLPLRRLRELASLPAEVREPLTLGPESAYLTPSQRRLLHGLSREFDKLNRAGVAHGDGL